MLYLECMNKEVIYLEPEDDITDILTKLQQAEQKIVALVPPKKATILRSAVNMKLVARVAKECEKVAVIVTADPAIVKMAMTAKIPVAKNLQSRPVVPTEENVKKAEADMQIIDGEDDDEEDNKSDKKSKMAAEASNSRFEADNAKSADTIDLTEEGLENGSKGPEKAKNKKSGKKPAKSNENASFFEKYRKLIVAGSFAAILLVVVLVWAFVFAPAVKITVAISSTPSNFAENIRFTTDQAAQDIENGLFYAQEITLDKSYKADIDATGEEDRGDKATGTLSVVFRFRVASYSGKGFKAGVTEGDIFTTTSGLQYRATETLTPVSWDGDSFPVACDNNVNSISGTCTKTFKVAVEAMNAGDDYNIPSGTSWQAFEEQATVTNSAAFIGGTTKMVKVISADDITKVKDTVLADHINEGKEDIIEDLSKDLVVVEGSFKGEVAEVTTNPTQGEEIKAGDDPTAEVKVTYSVYVVALEDIEKYIEAKFQVAADQKIYSIGEPYFERFTDIENEARLKTTVETGPTVTEEDILEKVKGKKTGQVQSLLRSINGVSSVNITTSYFWVWSVPNDPSRITIELIGEGE